MNPLRAISLILVGIVSIGCSDSEMSAPSVDASPPIADASPPDQGVVMPDSEIMDDGVVTHVYLGTARTGICPKSPVLRGECWYRRSHPTHRLRGGASGAPLALWQDDAGRTDAQAIPTVEM